MDMDSLVVRKQLETVIMEIGEAKSGFTDCESPQDDLECCVDRTYKAPKWRTPEHKKLRWQKFLLDTQRKRKKSRASKIARRINR